MKITLYITLLLLLFTACSDKPKEKLQKRSEIIFTKLPNTYLIKSSFNELPDFDDENYAEVLEQFISNCTTIKAKRLYGKLCKHTDKITDVKEFLTNSFSPYILSDKEAKQEGLLTGYYEPQLYASLTKSKKYRYPLYETPKDLIIVDLSSIYPALKRYRLRGKIEGNRLVPYDTRAQSKKGDVDADIICYCDSKIDRFFLEIQGSGRIKLDDNSTMFIGYDNQNGHKYRAIGRYLVKIGALELKNVSLQSIKAWLVNNPKRVDEVLNYNNSLVYFKQRKQSATGALGLELTPKRSIAVDRKYVPLGSMLYLSTNINEEKISRVVFAQDTGGAIKGSVRADLFLGAGDKALDIAGKLKSPLKLWILLPKNTKRVG